MTECPTPRVEMRLLRGVGVCLDLMLVLLVVVVVDGRRAHDCDSDDYDGVIAHRSWHPHQNLNRRQSVVEVSSVCTDDGDVHPDSCLLHQFVVVVVVVVVVVHVLVDIDIDFDYRVCRVCRGIVRSVDCVADSTAAIGCSCGNGCENGCGGCSDCNVLDRVRAVADCTDCDAEQR